MHILNEIFKLSSISVQLTCGPISKIFHWTELFISFWFCFGSSCSLNKKASQISLNQKDFSQTSYRRAVVHSAHTAWPLPTQESYEWEVGCPQHSCSVPLNSLLKPVSSTLGWQFHKLWDGENRGRKRQQDPSPSLANRLYLPHRESAEEKKDANCGWISEDHTLHSGGLLPFMQPAWIWSWASYMITRALPGLIP